MDVEQVLSRPRKRWRIAAAVVLLAFVATLVALSMELVQVNDLAAARKKKADKLDGYCLLVRASFQIDARDFRNPDERVAEAAFERFLKTAGGHTWSDLKLCATPDAMERIQAQRQSMCMWFSFYGCLARVADLAVEGIPLP